MGTSKTPSKLVSSPAAPASKQRTISSFFGPPKSSAAPAIKKTKPAPEKEPGKENKTPSLQEEQAGEEEEDEAPVRPTRRMRTAPQKRALEDADNDEDSDGDLYSKPAPKKRASAPAKKPRRSPSYEPEEEEDRGEADSTHLKPSTAARKTKQVSSERTDKYRFNPSSQAMELDEETEDMRTRKMKEKMHEKFVKKLGRPDSILEIRRRNNIIDPDDPPTTDADAEEAASDPDSDEPSSAITKKFGRGKPAAKAGAKKKLTPMEQQVVNLKRKNPDTLLVVEVGYKFRFFGEDARIAAQTLSIMCIPGKLRFDEHPSEAHLDKFASASIPVPRLHVHVKRLVAAGYKVGVVRQRETAALKAAGDNKNAPFVRELTNLYTKGTYIDDIDGQDDLAGPAASNTGYLLCITEKPGGGTGTDEKSHVGILAVQPATGDVIYDNFSDGFMRSEIETRLLHIAPCEFLIVGDLTKATEKLVSHLSTSTTTVFGDSIRVERVPAESTATATKHVSTFYASKLQAASSSDNPEANKLLDTVLAFPDPIQLCLSAMITHLTSYGLQHVFDLTKYFTPFSARSHMLLNGNTLSSLEIYRNQTDYTSKGSLFWTLDRTRTKMGRRLLRTWVGRPLLHREALEERVNAVEEIMAGKNGALDRVKELLGKVGYDLEKGLIRIYYGKCTRPELLQILQSLHRISTAFKKVERASDIGFKSRLLNEAVAALPEIAEDVDKFLGVFNHSAAAKDNKYDFFKEDEDEMDADLEVILEHKMGIAGVESELLGELKEITKTLKRKQACKYVSVSGIEYLIEVPNDKSALSLVPASWSKISGTKKVSRFHTPSVIRMLRERDQHRESLAASCDLAFTHFLATISTSYQPLRDAVHSLSTLDCLFSLATVASQPNYCKPEFTTDTSITVTAGRHPMVEQLLLDAYVPNDITLATSSKRAMVVTGPNMGGKSSYVRQVALISIMAQIGSYVPAASARLGLLDAVFTRMGAQDNMLAGESTFMVELSETSDILKMATERSLVILDELGRGTSTHDGVAIAHAVLDYVVREVGCLCLFVTHYPLLAQFGERYGGEVMNAHMRFTEAGAEGTEGGGEGGVEGGGEEGAGEDITFLYQIGEGVAHRSYGLNVARLAGLPKNCLQTAAVKSRELEMELKEKEAIRWASMLDKTMKGEEVDVVGLLKSIEFI